MDAIHSALAEAEANLRALAARPDAPLFACTALAIGVLAVTPLRRLVYIVAVAASALAALFLQLAFPIPFLLSAVVGIGSLALTPVAHYDRFHPNGAVTFFYGFMGAVAVAAAVVIVAVPFVFALKRLDPPENWFPRNDGEDAE